MINVKDIRNNCLHTNDGYTFTFIEIGGMSMELFSESEKLAYCKNITSIVSRFQFPYKYVAISSPYIIKHMVTADRNRLKNASGLCKQISAYVGIRLGVENKQHRRNYRKLYKHTDYRNEYRRTAIEIINASRAEAENTRDALQRQRKTKTADDTTRLMARMEENNENNSCIE